IPGVKYLREQVTEARGMPAKESLVKRLNFCIWTEGTSPWISPEIWLACREPKPVPLEYLDRKSTRLNSSHSCASRMPSSAWKKKRNAPQQSLIRISPYD